MWSRWEEIRTYNVFNLEQSPLKTMLIFFGSRNLSNRYNGSVYKIYVRSVQWWNIEPTRRPWRSSCCGRSLITQRNPHKPFPKMEKRRMSPQYRGAERLRHCTAECSFCSAQIRYGGLGIKAERDSFENNRAIRPRCRVYSTVNI